MENLVIELARYIIIILLTIYTLYCFTVFRSSDRKRQAKKFNKQIALLYVIHFICYLVLFLETKNMQLLILYMFQIAFFAIVLSVYKVVYRNLSRLVLNNMLMLLMFSFVMLTRLSISLAIKQFIIASVSLMVCLIVPLIIDKAKQLENLGLLYAVVGIGLLLVVLVFGRTQYGATNWLYFGGVGVQPSEFVKILYVFFIASLLSRNYDFRQIMKVSVLAGAHVILLVLEKDLGGALIFFITYLMMIYVASHNPLYLFAGLGGGSVAAAVAYKLFSHVRVRVMAWKDPWGHIDKEGYQITQSLFAIGTGGWFGLGLGKGLPSSIPVVESDFVFSAISEEFGGIVAFCIVLICLSCFIMFINIAMKMKRNFYKLTALGLGIVYGFQIFLTIGGVTKFIPSTGVTLPLISYGGSSVLSTIIIFCIIQGLYVRNK
ncbi:FtsW/RodA/SpoVE family cell cycle protein [Anaerosporobacter faecicola]|uniref:FtsW/RodA/SpoVE family cell cycle protein n=1 Tax=Anaerosporobacter faecicola TaxID=2718714 RepID=UPI001439BA5B|nr:FtsW/RodA/SpoVE family cell cycle protein [Anaerosporobacter faecicola]